MVANETAGIDGNKNAAGTRWYILGRKERANCTDEERETYKSSRPVAKQKKRTLGLEERVLSVSEVYYRTVDDRDELRRIRRACGSRRYKFLVIPTGVGDEKALFVSGKVKGTSLITHEEASAIIHQYSKSTSRKKISGNMGL
jgi:hypothetical protein